MLKDLFMLDLRNFPHVETGWQIQPVYILQIVHIHIRLIGHNEDKAFQRHDLYSLACLKA